MGLLRTLEGHLGSLEGLGCSSSSRACTSTYSHVCNIDCTAEHSAERFSDGCDSSNC